MRRTFVGAVVAGALFGVAGCSSEPNPPTPPTARPDAGGVVLDSGTPPEDAGNEMDAGELPDAGMAIPDGGELADAGPPDAGPVDAGCTWEVGNPPNLLTNPQFECGAPPEGWGVSSGAQFAAEETVVRTGAQSARVSTASGAAALALFPVTAPASEVGARQFCAEAWALAPSGTTGRITIRASGSGGANDNNFNAPMNGTWQRLHVMATTGPLHDEVTMRVAMPNAAPGAVLYVDDAALWETTDGGCAPR